METEFGIWEAVDTRSGNLQRIAIDVVSENEPRFDPSDYFLATTDLPERVGQIGVTGDNQFLDEYFCVQTC